MRKNGFTFLELMIAVVIGAFVTVTAVAAMRGITAGKQTHQQLTELSDEIRYSSSLIRKDLNNLYRCGDFRQAKFELSYLDGEGGGSVQSLTFYTVSRKKARPLQPEGDVYEVQYVVQSDLETERSILVRRCCPVAAGIPEAEDIQRSGMLAPIAENIREMAVRCYDGTDWVDEWNEENGQYPELVEVALLAAGNNSEKVFKRSLFIHVPRTKTNEEDTDRQGRQNQESGEKKEQAAGAENDEGDR